MTNTSGLWERGIERDRLAAVLDAAHQGHGGALLFRADPGLGKTRLLALAAAEAEGRFTVVSASGQEQEQAYPFAVLHQVFESLVRLPGTGAAELAHGVDVLRGWFYGSVAEQPLAGGGAAGRAALLYATYWLLASVAETRPLLLCVDDLHWSDPDSLEALRFVTRRLAGLPVAVVGAMRAWPAAASELAEGLVRKGAAELWDLRPLSSPSAEQLLAGVLGAPPTPVQVSEALRLTGGNPFLVEELGRLWRGAQPVAPPGRSASRRDSTLLGRLRGLPAHTLQLLEVASALGPVFLLEVAREVADMSPAEAEAALLPAEALGLVLPDQRRDRWSFLHPLLQRALYDSLGLARQRALHGQALATLRARGAPAAQLAPHLAEIAEPGDATAVADLRRAADEAEALVAYESAALHWRQAAALCLADGAERAELQFRLGLAEQRAGDYGSACRAFAAAAAARPSAAGLRSRIHAAWAFSLAFAGDLDGSRQHIALAEAEAEACSAAQAVEIGVEAVILPQSFGDVPQAQAAAERLWSRGRRSGDVGARSKAAACRAWIVGFRGQQRAYRWARQGAMLQPAGPPDSLELSVGWSPLTVFGRVATYTGHYGEARAALERVHALALARRCLPAMIWSATFLTELAWRQGRLREAFAHGDAVLDQVAGLSWMTAEPRVHRGRVLMEMGDLEGAEAHFATAAEEARAAGLQPALMLSLFAQATLTTRRGAWDRAAALFAQGRRLAESLGIRGPDPFRWSQEAIECLLHLGDIEAAAGLIDRLGNDARRSGHRGDRAIALRCRAMLAAAERRVDDAEADFAAALPQHRQAGEALEEGRTLLALGAFRRREGNALRARPVLDVASALFEACGAGLWRRQAEAERRAAGGRHRSRPGTGLLGLLTPQEYRVAELVSQGRSNREIACALLISPKTVETHLGHVYAKLALTTRGVLREHFKRHAGG